MNCQIGGYAMGTTFTVPPLPQIGGHFGGQRAKWKIWRTKKPNGGRPPEWRTLDTYDSFMLVSV